VSNTPDTDKIAQGNQVVPTEWAEQLERERNKAKQKVKRLLLKIDDIKFWMQEEIDELNRTIARWNGISVDRYIADITRVMDERDELKAKSKRQAKLIRELEGAK